MTAWWSNDYEAQSNMPVTINVGVTSTTIMWAAEEQFGADLTGSAVVQANGAGLTGTLTTLSTTLTAGTGEMLVYSGFLGGSGHNCTPGGNGTELFEISSGSSSKHHAYWEAVTPTNPQITITGGTTAQAAIIAVETAVTADRMVHRAGGGDDTDATSYTKTIPLIQGGGVLWVTAFSARTPSVTTPPVVPTLTLAGATFTLAHTVALPDAPPGDRLSVLYSQDYDAATGASLQFGFGAETQGYLTWSVDEDLGGAASGTPYAQVNASWTAGTTHSAALSAGTGNTFMVASARNDSVPGTYAPVGGVELVDTTSSATLKSLGAFWWPTVKTSPTVTTGTLTTQLIAFELKAAVVAVAEAEIGWAKLEVPDAVTQAELVVRFPRGARCAAATGRAGRVRPHGSPRRPHPRRPVGPRRRMRNPRVPQPRRRSGPVPHPDRHRRQVHAPHRGDHDPHPRRPRLPLLGLRPFGTPGGGPRRHPRAPRRTRRPPVVGPHPRPVSGGRHVDGCRRNMGGTPPALRL